MHFEITQTALSSEFRPVAAARAAACLDRDENRLESDGSVGKGPCGKARR